MRYTFEFCPFSSCCSLFFLIDAKKAATRPTNKLEYIILSLLAAPQPFRRKGAKENSKRRKTWAKKNQLVHLLVQKGKPFQERISEGLNILASQEGIEPPTNGLEVHCSIP